MPTVPVVFVVDDDPSVRSSPKFLIGSVGLQVESFDSAEALFEFLTKPFRDQDLLDAFPTALEKDRTRRCAWAKGDIHGCLRQGDHFSTLQWLLGFIAEALAQRAHTEG
jgi:FixJ family two-component response regulator